MSKQDKQLLGDLLVDLGHVIQENLRQALEQQKASGERLGKILVDRSLATEQQVAQALASQLEIEYIDLRHIHYNAHIIKRLPEELARKLGAIPLNEEDGLIRVGMIDPTDLMASDELRRLLRSEIEVVIITESDLFDMLDRIYRRTDEISGLMHPQVAGGISINLRQVTAAQALEAIQELYGYDYHSGDKYIFVRPAGLQTRMYKINYLIGQREGEAELKVASSSLTEAVSASTSGNTTSDNSNNATNTVSINRNQGSKVSTSSKADFWQELETSLSAIVGNAGNGNVEVSPMTGLVIVRAMPDALRSVGDYLRAAQLSIEQQVILQAKILEVHLSDGFQSGINWGAVTNNTTAAAQLSPGASLAARSPADAPTEITNGTISAVPGVSMAAAGSAGTLFGLAFQTANFAALIDFLETQGDVNVLSSPRIATLNNQKAVLKVGTDEFFATGAASTISQTTAVAQTVNSTSVPLQPFFSGVMLDVTPQVDESTGMVTLHVHPSVSQVTSVNKTFDLGSLGGNITLPLASSTVSETDSIVRARDGQIIAIGGLMQQRSVDARSGLPGLSKLLFGHTDVTTEKHELIILIKPTIVDSDADWSEDIQRSRQRMHKLVRKKRPAYDGSMDR